MRRYVSFEALGPTARLYFRVGDLVDIGGWVCELETEQFIREHEAGNIWCDWRWIPWS